MYFVVKTTLYKYKISFGVSENGRRKSRDITLHGLVVPYGVTDLDQQWLRKCLFAWQHRTITLTNVDASSQVFCGIHLKAMPQQMPINLIRYTFLNVTL